MSTQLRREQIKDGAINNAKQSFGTPIAGTDVAIKSYVDTEIANKMGAINLKDTVVVATTVAGTLATSFASGQVIDGVTLITGDRILIKNQATGSENGIYVVNATGAPTRATDADTAGKLEDAVLWVTKGTANGDTQWKLVTDGPLTIGTTSLVFANPSGTYLTNGNIVNKETPAGSINGTNTSFTLSFTPISGTEEVYLNGLAQYQTEDYTIFGATITYLVAPVAGDILRVNYRK